MSLQLAANHLAAQGRGPDTTLVHMGRGEVDALQGLAAAHGGMLTTNPTTGLPEAGFLSKILPMVAGAALTPLSGGLINPFTASMLVGGVTGLATGNLKKGLLAGLGAYGGANLATSLGAMGAAGSAGTAGAAGATSGGSAALSETAVGAATPLGDAGAGAVRFGGEAAAGSPSNLYSLADKGAALPSTNLGSNSAYSVFNKAPVDLATTGASSLPQPGLASFNAMTDPAQRFAAMQKGFTGDNLMNYASNNKLATAAAFAPVIAGAMAPPKYKEEEEDSDPGQQYNYEANPTEPTPEPDPYGRGQTYFKPRYVNAAAGGAMRGLPSAESNLGSYSAGGRGRLLRGPGDGVSDSIPAVIGNKQPARLADGEFVIPARIVSELGNGSTEAGAKQLYAMMDRIQKARGKTTGKKQVAKNTKAHKLMPA
jgi:hypothetical protein